MKDIERRDADLTNDKQIERLTKSGSKYLNLNPYEVNEYISLLEVFLLLMLTLIF